MERLLLESTDNFKRVGFEVQILIGIRLNTNLTPGFLSNGHKILVRLISHASDKHM